jgi:hypothetical protein
VKELETSKQIKEDKGTEEESKATPEDSWKCEIAEINVQMPK